MCILPVVVSMARSYGFDQANSGDGGAKVMSRNESSSEERHRAIMREPDDAYAGGRPRSRFPPSCFTRRRFYWIGSSRMIWSGEKSDQDITVPVISLLQSPEFVEES
jgi:hypothetical protein